MRDGAWKQARFTGSLKAGKAHGQGHYLGDDRGTFKGEFVDGVPSGKGVLKTASGGHYEGDYVAGKKQGQSVYVLGNRVRYDGAFVDDWPHGQGTLTLPSGETATGNWNMGCLDDGDQVGRFGRSADDRAKK